MRPHALDLTEGGTYPQLPTQPFFFTIFKLIQQSNMVTLSCLAKKKSKGLEEIKVQLIAESEGLWLEMAWNSTFSNKLNLFFLEFKFWFFFARQLKVTILDCCISFKIVKKIGCVGSCGYVPPSVKSALWVIFFHHYMCRIIVLYLCSMLPLHRNRNSTIFSVLLLVCTVHFSHHSIPNPTSLGTT